MINNRKPEPMKPATAVRFATLLTLLVLLQGCGFHLRGSGESAANLPADISPLHIQGLDQRDFLRTELEYIFVNSGIQVTDNASEAASLLRIHSRQSDRRVLTVNNRGKVLEYELLETLSFELTDRAGNVRVPQQSLDLTQIYTYRGRQVLGGQREETYLREDMWRRMSDQILRRISAQLR